ncbi:MAG: putative DNA binding domain-containing protein [Bacteroidaceae bacterium]|nr:putative DNA binding domain-containing protein [Bacteroidaceae bacterium]
MKRIYEYEDLQPVLEQMLEDKETGDVEFKSAAGGFPHSFWATYSSFANTDGGTIVFGVKEKDEQFYLDGLTEEKTRKYKKDFFNNEHNKEFVNIALLTENDVQTVLFEGVYILFFHIPRVDRSLRPVYCGLDPYTGTYRRDLEGDYHCSREEVNSMFADANLASPVDGKIIENFSKDDLDADSIKQYRRRFEQWNPDHVWNSLPEDKFLKKLNVFRRDRKTGQYGLTYAGLLMFGTYSAIMDYNPNFFPDYQEIVDPNDRWVNRICPDGNWESNLFQFYSRVLPILQNFLPKPFQLEGNQRKTETPAHVAVREALANALVHADYTENASLNIYKYPNKMVFSNPGIMLISLRQYYQGGESICRNKFLQTMFTFLGSAEKAGSGVDKIMRGWENLNWKRPYLVEKKRPNKVVLTLSMESLLDEQVREGLSKLYGDKITGIPQEQLMTLALAYTEEEITNERLQYALGMHKADITKMLGQLCKSHLLESFGRGRGTRYHVCGLNIGLPESNIGLPESNIGLPDPNIGLPESNIGLQDSNIGLKKKRYSKEEIRKLIIDYCYDWRTVEEIASYVGRKPMYIRDIVLPQLLDVIEKMYDVPHHPKQRYRTKQKEITE